MMRRKKRVYTLVGLLMVGVLSTPKHILGQADEELIIYEELLSGNEISGDGLSRDSGSILGDIQDPETADEKSVSASGNDITGLMPENETTKSISEGEIMLSESKNATEAQSDQLDPSQKGLSENVLSGGEIGDCAKVSENKVLDESERFFDVLLPAEIPFDIVLFGEEGYDALVRSEKFCIENRGDEDVRISIQAVCSGNEGEEYMMAGSSVKEDYVRGKKNVWICLQWEDENRRVLEQPGIVVGGDLDPGRGEIILKAQKKDKKGRIIGDNRDSKAFFSFVGDMKSDSDQIWKNEELQLDLDFSIEAANDINKNIEDNPNATEDIQIETESVNKGAEVY